MIEFIREHTAAFWAALVVVAGLCYELIRGLTAMLRALLVERVAGIEIKVSDLAAEQARMDARLYVVEDRTQRLEPLIQKLNDTVRDHIDAVGDLRVVCAEMRITQENTKERVESLQAIVDRRFSQEGSGR